MLGSFPSELFPSPRTAARAGIIPLRNFGSCHDAFPFGVNPCREVLPSGRLYLPLLQKSSSCWVPFLQNFGSAMMLPPSMAPAVRSFPQECLSRAMLSSFSSEPSLRAGILFFRTLPAMICSCPSRLVLVRSFPPGMLTSCYTLSLNTAVPY